MRVPWAGRLICALSLSSVLGADILAAQPPREGSNRSRKAGIAALSVVRDGSALLVSFRLDRALDERTWEKIESGLPTGFTYDIEVQRLRRRWFDQRVGATRLQVVAMYNALTREYQVNFRRDGELYASRVVTSAADLERALTVFEELPSIEIEDDRAGRFVLRVRAELRSRTRLGLIPDRVHTAWVKTPPFPPFRRSVRDTGAK
ncbi:MAG: DUF4390 domain-containing protein [Acidobacteria bacterium]|nr:DUF4390 domain-containing protein [Acidobacteriota bacterium]